MAKKKQRPSARAEVSPEKAGTILKHGEVRGHPLTEKQKGLFGAIRGKKGNARSSVTGRIGERPILSKPRSQAVRRMLRGR